MASENEAFGRMGFQTEVTGGSIINPHHESKYTYRSLHLISDVTPLSPGQVFTGFVSGTTTTSLEASGSL